MEKFGKLESRQDLAHAAQSKPISGSHPGQPFVIDAGEEIVEGLVIIHTLDRDRHEGRVRLVGGFRHDRVAGRT